MSHELNLLAISVGNTTTRLADVRDGTIGELYSYPSKDSPAIVQQAITLWQELDDKEAQIIIASSNHKASDQMKAALADQTSQKIWLVGEDIPPAIGQHLDPETITGVDRLLNAAAAWNIMNSACVIVDAGTCVTVDFVDGEGTFHGGAIAPGAAMQLKAMYEGTDSLPDIQFEKPVQETFGKNTAQAMLQGVYQGIRGMVRQLTEQYASKYGAYPALIATGGDAELLFKDDEFIEKIIPDLQLQGIEASVRLTLTVEKDG